MIADRFTVCECHMGTVPIGEEVFTVSGQIFCKECKALSERKTAREACGQITSKKHWKDEKKKAKASSQSTPESVTATERSTASSRARATA